MLEILQKRRSAREFTGKKLTEHEIDYLKESILRAPTSRNFEPCEFIFIDKAEILSELSGAKAHGANFLKNAALGVAVIGDTEKSDTCIEDASIAAITLQYAAESLGLGSCWAQINKRFDEGGISAETNVRNILKIPNKYMVQCIIGIGHKESEKEGHDRDDLDWSKIRHNSY